jgi:hypothetical protein
MRQCGIAKRKKATPIARFLANSIIQLASITRVPQRDLHSSRLISLIISAPIAVLAAGVAISAQDKYTVQVPNGLAFSEFRGYEDWPVRI